MRPIHVSRVASVLLLSAWAGGAAPVLGEDAAVGDVRVFLISELPSGCTKMEEISATDGKVGRLPEAFEGTQDRAVQKVIEAARSRGANAVVLEEGVQERVALDDAEGYEITVHGTLYRCEPRNPDE